MTEHADSAASASAAVEAFIARWDGTARAERANKDMFLTELCAVLGVEPPMPATGGLGAYRFERAVTHHEDDGSRSQRFIDLYKRGSFVLEAKQDGDLPQRSSLFGDELERRATVRNRPGWARLMMQAKGQAERYARDLPAEEGWPPFLIVCDIGFCFDLYADFSGTGKHYAQFPDREGFRVHLADLRRPAIRDRLRAVWLDPHSLDPSKLRDRITRDIAKLLARLVRSLEGSKQAPRHAPKAVATFLMRCIFSMFAQSIGLLPERDTFTKLLERCREDPTIFVGLVGDLWRYMNAGGFSPAIAKTVKHFNGGLFASGADGGVDPLPVTRDELDLLIIAAGKDWADVEPAIFGTLLENALDDPERAALGAHFTPRAFVERLVLPTIMEPLRAEWDAVKAAAVAEEQGGRREAAAKLVSAFHGRLAGIRVLDPACGSGNFLYVALELMKRLEGEVLDLLSMLRPGEGDRLALAGATVDPHNFLGLELNPRAVPVAELVLWIGWLQWHTRTNAGRSPPEPILRDFRNIREADALLNYKTTQEERDAAGQLVTRWGGKTKLHPITGEEVPDETHRVLVLRPVGAKPAQWPEADFIIGNPPFIGAKILRAELGSGYAEALWSAYPKVPQSADLAMFWWWKGAQSVASRKAKRFGFITSNSLRQVFCRKVVSNAMAGRTPIHLIFAIPDHPWVDGANAASVRIAMTVGVAGKGSGRLLTTISESSSEIPEVSFSERLGVINSDLSLGTNAGTSKSLQANERICSPGVKLHGAGFIVSPTTALSFGRSSEADVKKIIKPYRNGRDLTGASRNAFVIDLYGMTEKEVRLIYPAVYQHVLLRVKPERDENNRISYRENWWVFGEPRSELRPALIGLKRYIVTPVTAKHRVFSFLDSSIIPDDALIAIAVDSPFLLGVLSSSIHGVWSRQAGGTLEDRPRYLKSQCFDPFPFPDADSRLKVEISERAEEIDSMRKAVLSEYTFLNLTMLYNLREKLRLGLTMTESERMAHDVGRVSILSRLHDSLDAAVASAYGWPRDMSDADTVTRVVALNAERVAEEAAGKVRWLRPEYQAPEETRRRAAQAQLDMDEAGPGLAPWPKDLPAQYMALRSALENGPMTPMQVGKRFSKAPAKRLGDMLRTLAALGQAREAAGGRFAL